MNTTVLSTGTNLYHLAKGKLFAEMKQETQIPCVADIFVTQAFMDHGDYSECFRPYLHIIGEVRSVTGDFPCGVGQGYFKDDHNIPKVEYRYHLTNEELADLCVKGLFDPEFSCPDVFFDNHFELPLSCDCEYIPPIDGRDVPILFLCVNHPFNLEASAETSGYALTEYFEKPELEVMEELDIPYINEFGRQGEKELFVEEPTPFTDLAKNYVPAPEPTPEDLLVEDMFTKVKENVALKFAKEDVPKKTLPEAVKVPEAEPEPEFGEDTGEETGFVSEDSPAETFEPELETPVKEGVKVAEPEDTKGPAETAPEIKEPISRESLLDAMLAKIANTPVNNPARKPRVKEVPFDDPITGPEGLMPEDVPVILHTKNGETKRKSLSAFDDVRRQEVELQQEANAQAGA